MRVGHSQSALYKNALAALHKTKSTLTAAAANWLKRASLSVYLRSRASWIWRFLLRIPAPLLDQRSHVATASHKTEYEIIL